MCECHGLRGHVGCGQPSELLIWTFPPTVRRGLSVLLSFCTEFLCPFAVTTLSVPLRMDIHLFLGVTTEGRTGDTRTHTPHEPKSLSQSCALCPAALILLASPWSRAARILQKDPSGSQGEAAARRRTPPLGAPSPGHPPLTQCLAPGGQAGTRRRAAVGGTNAHVNA